MLSSVPEDKHLIWHFKAIPNFIIIHSPTRPLLLCTFPSFSNSSSKGSPSYQGCRQLGIGWSSPKRGPFPMNRFILGNFQQQVYCKLYLTPSGTFEKSISSLVFSVTGNMSQINPTASAVLSRTFPWMAKCGYILTKEPKKNLHSPDHLGQISRRVVDCRVDGWACGRGHQPG